MIEISRHDFAGLQGLQRGSACHGVPERSFNRLLRYHKELPALTATYHGVQRAHACIYGTVKPVVCRCRGDSEHLSQTSPLDVVNCLDINFQITPRRVSPSAFSVLRPAQSTLVASRPKRSTAPLCRLPPPLLLSLRAETTPERVPTLNQLNFNLRSCRSPTPQDSDPATLVPFRIMSALPREHDGANETLLELPSISNPSPPEPIPAPAPSNLDKIHPAFYVMFVSLCTPQEFEALTARPQYLDHPLFVRHHVQQVDPCWSRQQA